tara:strand:+ start:9506 stop:9985 length:480 start_codon:yes stop_codon:yes gene_type:complete
MPGVGKTEIGKSLSKIMGVQYIDIDYNIEIKESQAINEIINKRGEEVFRAIEKKEFDLAICGNESSVISTGAGVILDAENRLIIKNRTMGIHIKSSIKEIANRIDVFNRPLLYNTNKKKMLLDLWNERNYFYQESCKLEVDISSLSLKESIEKVYSKIL